ncbi:hypothetical protein DR950_18020 [Kitasatospora xanthocidica]|uniref:Uncharacterized protein n=2 Tax=Kitasatospora xanthocidica TaxID=83382 RepID=A0A372ZVU7_9ACTN|nr:hypothetical protein DR950_18020 [Kitasatospora xanthocidica]
MRWIAGLTRDPEGTWLAWARGHAVPVPLGTFAEVVRIPAPMGRAAVAVLLAHAPELVGPVIVDEWAGAVDIFVPSDIFVPGAPPVRQGDDVKLIGRCQDPPPVVICPSPGRRAVGRRWLCPPRALPGHCAVLTDPHRLAEALALSRGPLAAAG